MNETINPKDTLKQVAVTVTNDPVILTVDIKPQNRMQEMLQKLKLYPSVKKFTLTGATLGTLIRISRILLDIDAGLFDKKNLLESSYKAMDQYGEKVATCIALCIHNKKSEVPDSLVNLILNNFTSIELLRVLSIVVSQMDIGNFMTSIISIKGMNILESETAGVNSAERMSL